ncbi:MAG: hypothetical protein LBP80_03040 [Treponema sp.]|jgi:hypothetical protein|nr:hypothetical protein [Treponema sp.]
MAKDKAVYAPGELGKVRGRLGNLDPNEAERMARILGGDVGVEREAEPQTVRPPAKGGKGGKGGGTAGGGRGGGGSGRRPAPRHRVELAPEEDEPGAHAYRNLASEKPYDPADNPALPIKLGYRERVKMDRYMGQTEFEIKGPFQVLKSIISFTPPPDLVSARFINKRLGEYYKRIENLVTTTRALCPRNNTRRNEQLKRVSSFAYRIIDTIRYWKIESIASEMTRLQLHPRENTIPELAELLKLIYKPIFILDQLDLDTNIREAYKLVYKIIFLENPGETVNKQQEMVKTALISFSLIKKEIRYLLYPLLMKLLSDRWLPYEDFFIGRRNRLMVFLGIAESEQLLPSMAEIPKSDEAIEDKIEKAGNEEKKDDEPEDEDTVSREQNAKRVARESERKAVDRGLKTLEAIFPQAGWDRAPFEHDFYPYFADVFKLQKEYALISPLDGLQQVVILIRMLQELFYGLRSVAFGVVPGPGGPDNLGETLGAIINNWHYFITALEKEYLPRLSEYCRILENASESRSSNYARRLLDELYWIKQFFFLPYFRFDSSFPPPIQKKDVTPLYPDVRSLRRCLTAVAGGIEKGTKAGGAAKKASCEGIDNPWEPYNFQVPNPVSLRLNAILGPNQRNNASLIFFTLAAVIVLDFLVNNDESWVYQTGGGRPEPLFRSVDNEGVTPQRGVDKEIDTEAILKEMVKRAKAKSGG